MKKQTKTVMFDLDGTVLDTLPDIAFSANYALKKLGFPEQSMEQIRMAIGHGIRNLLKDLMKREDQEILEECRSIFQDHYNKNKTLTTRPYDGIIELLQSLKDRGNRFFLISNKYDGATQELVTQFFGNVFDGVYGSRDGMLPKPDRAIFDLVCDEHLIDKENVIYIGDSEVDCEFAKNCNIPFIGVSWGFRKKEELIACGAQIIVDSVSELKDALLSFCS
ncbi:MAG: HAD family hydrolase [Clostridia bacterium]|nr:HAD family hydrolase [Clostridia bacterium]